MRSLLITSTVAVALLVGCGGGGSSATPTPQRHALQGKVTLISILSTLTITQLTNLINDHAFNGGPPEPDDWKVGEPCNGSRAYAEIQIGTQVVVTNSAGNIVATGSLVGGSGAKPLADKNAWTTCVFSFSINDVPDSDFYSIEVGHQGALTYSRSDMESNNWTLTISLGP